MAGLVLADMAPNVVRALVEKTKGAIRIFAKLHSCKRPLSMSHRIRANIRPDRNHRSNTAITVKTPFVYQSIRMEILQRSSYVPGWKTDSTSNICDP